MNYLAHIKDSLDKTEEPDPNFVFKYRYLLALAKIHSHDLEYGRTILRDLISLQPDFAPGYVSLAMTYISESNERAAEFIIRRGMDRSPENANFYTVLGAIAKKKRRNSTAARYFNKALELNENNVPALVNRSTIAIENLEYERAELDLKKALSIEPDSEDAMIALAVVQRMTGRISLAKGTLEKAIEINPTGALGRFHLAELYLDKLQDAEYALQLFYEVLQTNTKRESLRTQAKANIEKIKRARL
jgi:tetratricopeptide (TPR) repeat protein